MPTSSFDEIPLVLKLLVDLEPAPRRVLDVGIGNGKFGFLCREYLRYWKPGAPPPVRVDGIEAFPAYVGPLQRAVYDHVYIGDAAAVLPTLPDDGYDLVLLIDVIEHFTREQGAAILAHCRRVGTVVIAGTPGRFEPQGDAHGNAYERHLSFWSRKDLLELGASLVLPAENTVAAFARSPERDRYTRAYRLQWAARLWLPPALHAMARRAAARLRGRQSRLPAGPAQTTGS